MSSVGKRIADARERASSALDRQPGGSHYKDMAIQPVEFITANNIPYREANVIKYACRHQNKNGLQDIEKAIHYLEMIKDEYCQTGSEASGGAGASCKNTTLDKTQSESDSTQIGANEPAKTESDSNKLDAASAGNQTEDEGWGEWIELFEDQELRFGKDIEYRSDGVSMLTHHRVKKSG